MIEASGGQAKYPLPMNNSFLFDNLKHMTLPGPARGRS
jgi:hypothetical protein